ncbi:MAG TPA: radical SAM family heme chaperone HemW [Candidatus Omnitrophota bacterium]|nr:radical SAM family heme chaperone HemW [Candidatus Omnitrophota bacterium]
MAKGLYVHIPFCQTRCHYCNFVTTADHSPVLQKRFFDALSTEIKYARSRFGKLVFDTLYLGGGTPSSLSIPEISRLVAEVRSAFDFRRDFEFTIEFNPGDGEETKLKEFHALGVNRVSLGCQAFQDELLKRLGRRHTVEDIIKTINAVRRAKIENISFDLMLRLPGQTREDFNQSLQRCVELGASQVSLYDLEVHEKTPFGKLQQAGKLGLPGEDEHARMYEDAIKILSDAGYEHYEISNFAKPGMASRHNLIYWHNEEYLGLGPAAFSYLEGVRFQFAPGLESYLEKCEAKDWKNNIEDRLSEEEKETETFVMGLRLKEGIPKEKCPEVFKRLQGRIKTLCDEGQMKFTGNTLWLTERGKFLAEEVFGFLLEKEMAK